MKQFLFIEWYRPSIHDVKACVSIICLLLGIGSLSMAYAFAQAGPIAGTLSLIIMCFVNIYATILLYYCFKEAPESVQSFSELGYYVAGRTGEMAVLFSQIGTCLLVPIVFLIIGGQLLLRETFKGAVNWESWHWILVMTGSLLPLAIGVRTLKESYIATIMGAVTAFLAISLAMGDAAVSASWDNYAATEVQALNILPVFGSMALAYGAALIVPTIIREHPNPRSLPGVIAVAMSIISIIYLIIAILGYLQFGCTSPSNLLLSMTHGPWKRIAYIFMLLHVLVAYAMLLIPTMFFFEKIMFKLDSQQPMERERMNSNPNSAYTGMITPEISNTKQKNINENEVSKPGMTHQLENGSGLHSFRPSLQEQHRTSIGGISSKCGDIDIADEMVLSKEYTMKQKIQSLILRLSIILIQTFLAILLQSCFTDVADFIGATTLTICCILLPCIFYYKMFHHRMSFISKCFCLGILLFCGSLGIYTAYKKLENVVEKSKNFQFFSESSNSNPTEISYPFCPANHMK